MIKRCIYNIPFNNFIMIYKIIITLYDKKTLLNFLYFLIREFFRLKINSIIICENVLGKESHQFAV